MDPRYLDHFNNPRNVGRLPTPDGVSETENPVCGDRIRLTVELEDGRVSSIAYTVQGCSGAIACASAMTELVLGTQVIEALKLDRDAIAEALGGLPTLKRHGADLAIEGLRAVLADAKKGKKEAE
jgi:nitrogen fixation protein NifU and related proteins